MALNPKNRIVSNRTPKTAWVHGFSSKNLNWDSDFHSKLESCGIPKYTLYSIEYIRRYCGVPVALYEPIKRRIDIQMALEVHRNQLPKSFNPKIENQILPIFSKTQSSNDHHLYKYTHSFFNNSTSIILMNNILE